MSRPIINADEHLVALSKHSKACVAAAVQCIKVARSTRVYLHSHDFQQIVEELRGSGFDLGRGFKICGVKVEKVDNHP